ncbi:hypothetical protein CK203_077128 [Vitis vinifera]|uniref:WRC domain-containing protein n=1 Tax=Vitis vinifera TaxID=29760 RepID=A0A438D5S7_VITVI|nr:hypothetical protein CK203_077128 [Vitis vinifera]
MRIRGRGAPPLPSDLPSSPPPSQLHHGNDQSVQSPARNQSPLHRLTIDGRQIYGITKSASGKKKAVARKWDWLLRLIGALIPAVMRVCCVYRSSNSSPSPETSAVMEHWREEDRAVPLKKRRATFEMETMMEIKDEKAKKRMMRVRRNRPKKWVEEDEGEENGMAKNNGKKGRSGAGIILEGSRCSRVNGRGWRCHQQTLVGYSLCEHHLGKGRLKSMTSVKSSPLTAPVLHKPTKPETNTEDEEESDGMREQWWRKRARRLGR